MTDNRTPTQVQADNIAIAMGRGPGLYRDMGIYVIEHTDGEVLIGGLGGMGVGRMWVPLEDWHRELPGWKEAS